MKIENRKWYHPTGFGIITRMSIFVLLGAILNVAVAWTCVMVVTLPGPTTVGWNPASYPDLAAWQSGRPAEAPEDPMWSNHLESFGARITAIATQRTTSLGTESYAVRLRDAGWPSYSLHGSGWFKEFTNSGGASWTVLERRLDGIMIIPSSLSRRMLPLQLLWPGFAIDTAFYAAILWLLFAFPFDLRRRRRIKRGLCISCGYDLRAAEHNVCPECGAAASNSSSPVNRIACLTILFLFLGAIINVAVAWGCALTINLENVPINRTLQGYIDVDPSQPSLKLNRREVIGAARVQCIVPPWMTVGTISPPASSPPVPPPPPPPIPILTEGIDLVPPFAASAIMSGSDVLIDWRGWPQRSLWCRMDSSSGAWKSSPSQGGLQLTAPRPGKAGSPGVPGIVLPLWPLWPAFATDTAIYAACCFFVVYVPVAVRRHRRERRGCCLACGYDLRASESKLCPECGVTASKPS